MTERRRRDQITAVGGADRRNPRSWREPPPMEPQSGGQITAVGGSDRRNPRCRREPPPNGTAERWRKDERFPLSGHRYAVRSNGWHPPWVAPTAMFRPRLRRSIICQTHHASGRTSRTSLPLETLIIIGLNRQPMVPTCRDARSLRPPIQQ